LTRQRAYATIELMKKRSTTPVSKSLVMRGSLLAIAILMAAATPVAFMGTPTAARDFDAEIRAVQRQIDRYNSEARKLAKEADTLANKVAQLDSEKARIQAQINLSQKKHDKIVADIKKNEKRIADNQEALGETMADMYVDDDISPLEMLASSNNIADYIDKQAQRSSIRDSLSDTIAEIKRLKAELEKQRTEVKRVLANQKNQRDELAAKQAEQQRLLNATKGREAAYKKLSGDAKKKQEKLIQEQQAAIAARYAGRGGMISADNLPAYAAWAGSCYVDNAGWSHGGAGGGGQDPVGYGCNQCVSYTAWKMGQVTGFIPSYWGNANMWPASARNAGFATGSGARANSLGVISAGQYGHIVYVESVNADGTINISQYNEWLNGEGGKYGFGHFSRRYNVSPATYDTYIYL
jgi:surface antigen/peptidoglycan hydrolase CwlO-like protein